MEIFVFVLGAGTLLILSRKSILSPRSHGFYRFFAWVILWGMFLLQAGFWFADPFSWHQIISWLLLVACLAPVLLGVRALRNSGRPDPARKDDSLIAFEKTTALVASGIYRYIRHPLYSSLLLLGWGIFFKRLDVFVFFLAIANSFFLWMTTKMEEREDLAYFGEEYREYMNRTKRFLPFLF